MFNHVFKSSLILNTALPEDSISERNRSEGIIKRFSSSVKGFAEISAKGANQTMTSMWGSKDHSIIEICVYCMAV